MDSKIKTFYKILDLCHFQSNSYIKGGKPSYWLLETFFLIAVKCGELSRIVLTSMFIIGKMLMLLNVLPLY